MSFEDTLKKAAGKRFSCQARCCGYGYAAPCTRNDGPEFELTSVVRLIVASVLFAAALIASKLPAPWPLVILIASALISGYDIIAGAVLSCIRGSYFDKTVLITAAGLLTFLCGYARDAAALVLLYQISELAISYAFTRTRSSVLEELAPPRTARVARGEGEESLDADTLSPGEILLIAPGETVCCDCVVLSGGGVMDCSATGGPGDLTVGEGDELPSGSVSVDCTLRCEVSAAARDSAEALLARTAASAADRGEVVSEKLRHIITLSTPVLVIAAVLAAAAIALLYKISAAEAIHRALMFLLVANPCAALIAAPLVYFCTITGAAREGIVFGSADAVGKAARMGTVAFDRAGTLTDGNVKVTGIKSTARIDPDTLLKITAHALSYSSNPLAKSVISAYGGTIYIELVQDFTEAPAGVEVRVDSGRICVGSAKYLASKGAPVPEGELCGGMVMYVAIAGEYVGRITLSDGLRGNAAAGIDEIRQLGAGDVIMFTDEDAASAAKTASALGIKEYYSSCDDGRIAASLGDIRHSLPPQNTLAYVHSGEKQDTDADLDVRMGDIPSLADGRADLTLLGGDVGAVASAVTRAKAAATISYGILGAATLVKLVLLVLSFTGMSAAWFTVLVDGAATSGAVLASILAYRR
jgi:Cd2+/Zn2+-exporting ATPase